MDKLFDLLFQNHPDFKEEIEGCTQKEVEDLEKLVINCEIPDDYKIFLKHMGKKTGRISGVRRNWKTREPEITTRFMNQEILIDYQSVLDFYRKIHKKKWLGVLSIAEDYEEEASNFFLFGIDCLGNDNGHFYLDLRYPDLPVVEISSTIEFKQHSEIIAYQDHIEQRLDGIGSDMFCIGPGNRVNIPQWRPSSQGGSGFVDSTWSGDQWHDTVQECFRHRGGSMTVWLDGHVTEIKETTGEDIPPSWYTGNPEDNL